MPNSLKSIAIRQATPADASAITVIFHTVAAERVYSAIDAPWTVEQEQNYIASLSPREAVYVAIAESGEIVGFQTLDLWAPTLASMAHVAQLGTFLLPEWRRSGIGQALFRATAQFARDAGYAKMVIQVRAMNEPAQAFYRKLGFRECGRFTRQVRTGGIEDDGILMELFL